MLERVSQPSTASAMSRKEAPKDLYHMVAIIFFILGLGTLLPWNFFITAIPYFLARLAERRSDLDRIGDFANSENVTFMEARNAGGNVTSEQVGRDEFNFSNWMTLLAQLPLLLFTLLNSFLYQWIPDKVRIVGSMVGILFLFILTTVVVKVDMTPQSFFSITMATIWFINSFCAILQGSLFGMLGSLPQKYCSLFLSGQGMAGMLAAIAMLLSMASGVDAQTSALSYFVTPCIGTFISIICYLLLPHLEFTRYHLNKSLEKSHEMETQAQLLQKDQSIKAVLSLRNVSPLVAVKEPEKASVFVVLRKIWMMALCIVLAFGATLAVFPAITASVQSLTSEGQWSIFFNPVCCFLLFNIMDWLGRSATSYFLWPGKDSKLLPLLVCLRFIFVPLFMLCNVPKHYYLHVVFEHDAWFIIFMVFFAFSNGYLVSLTMCLAPKKVLPHEAEMAGAVMTFFLALGLSCGAGLSFGFKALL